MSTLMNATYGAVLSKFLVARGQIKNSRGIAVRCRLAVATPPAGGIFVVLEAFNKHPRPVTIVEAGLRLSNNLYLRPTASNSGQIPLPRKLDFGDRAEFNFDLFEVEKFMKVQPPGVTLTHAFVRDAGGEEYISRLPRSLKNKLSSRPS